VPSNIAAVLGLPQVEAQLPAIEAALAQAVRAGDPFLTEVAGHLLGAGGKRLRPALTAGAALAGGSEITREVIQGGVSVELVHLGSLYHDDVMDEAGSRRGVQSVNSRWGNLVAILAGDFLLARASEIAAGLGTEVAALLARTIGRLCEGQVGELQTAFSVERTEEQYLSSIAGKTASLLSAGCRIGGLTAGLPATDVEALTRFGEHFGMVFQMVDDVLDLTGTEADLGKPAGHDMEEGVYTLPVILALADDDGGELAGLLGGPLEAPERDKALALVRTGGAIATTVDRARAHATRAEEALAGLAHPAAAALAGAGHRLLDTLA
jgi:heptaprenyl diphosphate synthase